MRDLKTGIKQIETISEIMNSPMLIKNVENARRISNIRICFKMFFYSIKT